MGRVTKVTPTKVTKGTKVITAVTKIKAMVTRVLVEATKGKIPVGGDPTRLPIQRDKTKV